MELTAMSTTAESSTEPHPPERMYHDTNTIAISHTTTVDVFRDALPPTIELHFKFFCNTFEGSLPLICIPYQRIQIHLPNFADLLANIPGFSPYIYQPRSLFTLAKQKVKTNADLRSAPTEIQDEFDWWAGESALYDIGNLWM